MQPKTRRFLIVASFVLLLGGFFVSIYVSDANETKEAAKTNFSPAHGAEAAEEYDTLKLGSSEEALSTTLEAERAQTDQAALQVEVDATEEKIARLEQQVEVLEEQLDMEPPPAEKGKRVKFSFVYATRNDNYMGRPVLRLQASLRALQQALDEYNLRSQSEVIVMDWWGHECIVQTIRYEQPVTNTERNNSDS